MTFGSGPNRRQSFQTFHATRISGQFVGFLLPGDNRGHDFVRQWPVEIGAGWGGRQALDMGDRSFWPIRYLHDDCAPVPEYLAVMANEFAFG